MAGKRKDDIDALAETPVLPESSVEVPASGPPTGDFCILVNLSKSPLSCPLRNGRNINLGPKTRGLSIHRSEPVLKKDRTDILFAWERSGRLAFENLPGGESA